MADDIDLTNDTFGTTDMKPSPDEEASALWGRKVAANTGFLFTHKFTIGTAGTSSLSGDTEYTIACGSYSTPTGVSYATIVTGLANGIEGVWLTNFGAGSRVYPLTPITGDGTFVVQNPDSGVAMHGFWLAIGKR